MVDLVSMLIFISMSNRRPIKENEFFPAPGGTSGAINVQPGWGTFASPEASQNPAQFQSSNQNKAKNANLGVRPNVAKEIPKQGQVTKDLDAIYAKRDVPSPDEVISGLKFEMGQQNKKDKKAAKEAVLANLKKNPHYYSELNQLNIDDKSMVDNMTESAQHPNDAPARPKVTPNIEETKKIFAQMGQAYGKKYVVNSQISEVMKEMWAAKQQRSAWRTQKS